jgi:DNA-binding XRE family transcriptional regulator
MIITGIIKKQEGPWWSAEAEAIGAFTQGRSRRGAAMMLKDLVETMIDQAGFRATVKDVGVSPNGVVSVFVESNDPAALAARVLKYQREVHGLTLADISKVLGVSSRNAFARYEQGKTEPTIGKYNQLLAAVAPEMSLVLGRRGPARSSKAVKSRTRRSA